MASAAPTRMNIGFLLTAASTADDININTITNSTPQRSAYPNVNITNMKIPPLPALAAFDHAKLDHDAGRSPVAVMGFNADARLQDQIREAESRARPLPYLRTVPPPPLTNSNNNNNNVMDPSVPSRKSSLPARLASVHDSPPATSLLHRQSSLPTELMAATEAKPPPNININNNNRTMTPGPGGGHGATNTITITNSNTNSSVKKYVCDVAGCSAEFGQKGSLTRHHKSRHEGRRPHACTQCSKRFSEKWTLNVHERNVHEKRKPHVCGQCPKKFGERWNLRKHINVVHRNIKPYKCPQCRRAFGYKGDMRKHVMELHVQDGRPFQCPVPECAVKFARLRYLRRHQNLSHGNNTGNNNKIQEEDEEDNDNDHEDDDNYASQQEGLRRQDKRYLDNYATQQEGLRRQDKRYNTIDIDIDVLGQEEGSELLTTEQQWSKNDNNSLQHRSIVRSAIACNGNNRNTNTNRTSYSPLETLSLFAAAAADEEMRKVRR